MNSEHPMPGRPDQIRIRPELEIKLVLNVALELWLNKEKSTFTDCVDRASTMYDTVVFEVTKKRNLAEGKRRTNV